MNRFLVILFIFPALLYAQSSVSDSLDLYIDNIISTMPAVYDNNDYTAPSASVLTQWNSVVENIINANYSTANTGANAFGYEVIQFTDTSDDQNKIYYILKKMNDSLHYWGTFVFNPSPLRQRLIIMSPHPKFDTNTGAQGLRIFKNLGARIFGLSGTHRCNASSLSTCDGTTDVCGVSEKYKISDQAHNISTFHQTTLTLNNLINNLIVVQPHGFSKGGGDPDLIMSNGIALAPSTDYLLTLKNNLLTIDNTLTFKIAHIDTPWTRLIATVNTQGRLINGSGDPCDINPVSNSGRFLHIEQAYTGLRDNKTNWNKLSDALESTFAPEPLPVEMNSFEASAIGMNIIIKWTTATERNNYGFEIEKKQDNHWINIGFVKGYGFSNSPKEYSFKHESVGSGISYYRLKQVDNDGKFEYSRIVMINSELPQEYNLYQNYPNPFNPVTTISYSIPVGSFVQLKVFNLLGQEASSLVNEEKPSGSYSVTFNGANLPSGIYIYTLTANAFTQNKKLIILK